MALPEKPSPSVVRDANGNSIVDGASELFGNETQDGFTALAAFDSMGQEVALKLSAFNQRVTPELNGVVEEIAADLSVDERSGAGFYTVRVSLPLGTEEVERPYPGAGHAAGVP